MIMCAVCTKHPPSHLFLHAGIAIIPPMEAHCSSVGNIRAARMTQKCNTYTPEIVFTTDIFRIRFAGP